MLRLELLLPSKCPSLNCSNFSCHNSIFWTFTVNAWFAKHWTLGKGRFSLHHILKFPCFLFLPAPCHHHSWVLVLQAGRHPSTTGPKFEDPAEQRMGPTGHSWLMPRCHLSQHRDHGTALAARAAPTSCHFPGQAPKHVSTDKRDRCSAQATQCGQTFLSNVAANITPRAPESSNV